MQQLIYSSYSMYGLRTWLPQTDCTHNTADICSNAVTLKSKLRVTQGHYVR